LDSTQIYVQFEKWKENEMKKQDEKCGETDKRIKEGRQFLNIHNDRIVVTLYTSCFTIETLRVLLLEYMFHRIDSSHSVGNEV
jgi:hypothetical protein